MTQRSPPVVLGPSPALIWHCGSRLGPPADLERSNDGWRKREPLGSIEGWRTAWCIVDQRHFSFSVISVQQEHCPCVAGWASPSYFPWSMVMFARRHWFSSRKHWPPRTSFLFTWETERSTVRNSTGCISVGCAISRWPT